MAPTWIRLAQLANHIPPGPTGKPRSRSTIYRYALRGKYGVRLETQQLPDGLYTTLASWRRFLRRLTAARASKTAPLPASTTRQQRRRQSSVEVQIEAARASIRKRAAQPESAKSSRSP
jgi:hypothetical protein